MHRLILGGRPAAETALDNPSFALHAVRMLVPYDQLQPQTLQALIEEFLTRDGSIQGHTETPLERKTAAVMQLLKSGEAAIVFDPDDETCSIAMKNSLGKEPRLSLDDE